MKRAGLIARLIALVVLALVAAASISISACATLHVADRSGAPAVVYVAYRYQGSMPNLVHPLTYDASGLALIRGDSNGRVEFPLAIHAHWPFPIQTHPSLQIEMAYVPSLHSAVGPLSPYMLSRPDVFEYDAAGRRLVLSDLSGRPDLWERTLWLLSSMIDRFVSKGPGAATRLRDRDPRSADLALELVAHFRREYDAFLRRHGDAPRPMPEMPPMTSEEEKRRWADAASADLARVPTWGALVTRVYGDDLGRLPGYEEQLR